VGRQDIPADIEWPRSIEKRYANASYGAVWSRLMRVARKLDDQTLIQAIESRIDRDITQFDPKAQGLRARSDVASIPLETEEERTYGMPLPLVSAAVALSEFRSDAIARKMVRISRPWEMQKRSVAPAVIGMMVQQDIVTEVLEGCSAHMLEGGSADMGPGDDRHDEVVRRIGTMSDKPAVASMLFRIYRTRRDRLQNLSNDWERRDELRFLDTCYDAMLKICKRARVRLFPDGEMLELDQHGNGS
jgi:hypothetical protein